MFVALDIGSRRLVYFNVTEHPMVHERESNCEKRSLATVCKMPCARSAYDVLG